MGTEGVNLRERLCPDAVPRHDVPCAAVRGIAFRPRTSHKIALAACCAVLLISACSSLPFARGTSDRPHSSSINCQTLASKGVSTCPPANPELASPQMINHSQGRVSTAQFMRYADALLRTLAYEQFALNTSQASVLQLGSLATRRATNLIFSGDLAEISAAKKQGAKLTSVQGSVSTIKLVTVSAVDQGYIQSDGYVARPLAWVVTWTSLQGALITSDSSFTVVWSANTPASSMLWGAYHSSSSLGRIWTFDGSTSCASDPVWQAVCNE